VYPLTAPALLDLLVDQLIRMQKRKGRRAARVSFAIPMCLNQEGVRESLMELLRSPYGLSPVIELVPSTDGRPRLLTVDFDLESAG
jgi:hypothetical protein